MTQTLGQSVKAFMLWIFNTVDTELARRVMASENKGGQTGKEGGVVLKEELGVRS